MNMKMFLGGTIALALTLAVVSASAEDVQMYGATFESSVSTTSGELNDWAYELSAGVTTYADTKGEPYGWFGGADEVDNIGLGVVQSESPISYKDPEGRDIEDPVLVEWFLLNDFTQADINALGDDTAATDKLYECFLLNCSIKAQELGGALSVTGFAVSNKVSITVQLVRQDPLGFINGVIHIYGADDLATDFSLISEESVGFGADDDPIFDTTETEGAVTQSVTAFFNKTDVTAKFFKAKIEFPIVDNGEGGDEGGDEGGEEE